MHRKFKEKMECDHLLNEIEQASHEIQGIYFTSKHLYTFCKEHQNVNYIKNMTYIIETMMNNLYCLSQELQSIVDNQKYHTPDMLDTIAENLANDNYIFDDD